MRGEFLRTAIFRALRLGFRIAPLPVATRDRLRQRFLAQHAGLVPTGPRGRAGSGSAHRPLDHAAHRAIDWMPASASPPPANPGATAVAFYLPQFHPFAENDAWWGKGFTEWRNVARALPQFEGHLQPRLPGDLGFYDLRLPSVMHEQAALARQYGIAAFCTYFYWFAGKTLMEAPLRAWLADSALDMPICLCWANENWSRRWDGREDQVLISQAHSPGDDLAFIAHVAPYLRDARYLRVEGKPLLLVYRPGLLPEAAATAARWREWCREHGVGEIHLAYVQSFDNVDPRDIGFDAAVAFPPNNTSLEPITGRRTLINDAYRGQVYDWRQLATAGKDPAYRLYPGVNPGWDNEARRSGAGRTYVHASPAGYARWLRHAAAVARRRSPAAPLVFVNAWNEWAEGAVLEPDALRGHAWLEATRSALTHVDADPAPCAVVHAWDPERIEGLLSALDASGATWRVIVTTTPERETAVRDEIARLGATAEVLAFPNRGGDILPFLKVLARLALDGTRIVLKLPANMSAPPGAVLAPGRAPGLLAAFAADPTLGLIAPDGHAVPLRDEMGANGAGVAALAHRMGLARATDARFIVGGILLARVDALLPLLEMDLCDWEFDADADQADGTLAQAIERVVALAVAQRGLQTREAHEVTGEAPRQGFSYAARDR